MGQILLYFLLAIIATTTGAVTGMGGGIIIKPVLDAVGQYDAATINVLSSLTVLAMALVSVGKQIHAKARIDLKVTLPLALGAVAGGWLGGEALRLVINDEQAGASFIIQNIILAALIICVFFYMLKKEKLPRLHCQGVLPSLCVGLFLGAVSSFLGIGGGPINVALIIFMFSYTTKQAATASLVIILFSQITKLCGIWAGGGFAGYNLAMLPGMVVGAVAGGFIGAHIQHKLAERQVEILFNIVQLVVFGLCIFNIVRYT